MSDTKVQMMKFNPFRPNSISSTSMFAGRNNEISHLIRMLFQTRNNNSQSFIIHGERGIGKSSLMLFIRDLANGSIALEGAPHFNFLTMNIVLTNSDTYLSILLKISRELNRVLIAKGDAFEGGKNLWEFLKKWEVFGVKYQDNKERMDEEIFEDCANSIATTLIRLNTLVDGLLILVDEADKPPAQADLGAMLKNITERFTLINCNNVIFGISGLSVVLDKLRDSHASSLRNFTIMPLTPLLPVETAEVIRKAVREANGKNSIEMKITKEAFGLINYLSEGYPHFIQQFGYSAFESDIDWEITEEDVFEGAFRENGAFHQLGTKYFSGIYFDQIGSDEYRSVLRAMATKGDDWITKDEIRATASIKETSLNNAISTLKARNVIITKDGVKGVYRLPSKSFSVWIKHFASDKKR